MQAIYLIQTHGKPEFKDPDKYSPELKDFLDKSLKVDPEERASAADLLKHPFMDKSVDLKVSLKKHIMAAREALNK